MSKSKVLFIMTGSIACYKACHVISRLVQANCDVQVVASSAALQFVGNATLEGLSGKPVISDMYARGNVMDHIHLMRWADLVLVAPGTASFINKAAQGVGDDLIQTLFLAHDFQRPFLVAPAMNKSMYSHPVTQKSLNALRDIGIQILDSASGILACGEEGWGRLLEPDLILNFALEALRGNSGPSSVGKLKAATVPSVKILVTAGGTQEPIDTVRAITNLSTGKTGTAIAEHLSHMGLNVTLLQSESSVPSNEVVDRETFTSFASLDQKMRKLLGTQNFTHVIHAAAVSDYSLDKIEVGGESFEAQNLKKISSDAPTMSLHLKRNHKIVDELKKYSQNQNLKVIAFKLTSDASEEKRAAAVQKLFAQAHADLVVHNDVSEIDKNSLTHPFHLHSPQGRTDCKDLTQLTHELIHFILPKDTL